MSDVPQPPTAGDDEQDRTSLDPTPSESGPLQPLPPGGIRASDAEREDVVAQLGEHATTGRLTLAELDERITLAYTATTRGELDRLVDDLPSPGTRTVPGVTSSTSGRHASRWLVGIMGGSDRQGRWRVADHLNAVAIMGGHTIDLRDAELTSQETTIVVLSIMGGSDVLVPDSIDVTVGGFSVMGGNSEYGVARSPSPGAPRVRILAYNLMGGSDIYRVSDEARGMSVRQAKKFTKKQRNA